MNKSIKYQKKLKMGTLLKEVRVVFISEEGTTAYDGPYLNLGQIAREKRVLEHRTNGEVKVKFEFLRGEVQNEY